MNRQQCGTLGCVAATMLLASQGASAQESEALSLDPVNVSADGYVTEGTDITIEQESLQDYQANDLEDIFAGDPEVTAGGGPGAAQRVYLRGIEESLLNLSVDGASQSGSLFHHTGRLSIAPELLKRVEVEAGAGRATSGPGALGGSLRFVTKDPDDLLRAGEQFTVLTRLSHSSNTDGHDASASVASRFGDTWSGLFSLGTSDHDNYEDGDGNERLGTDADQQLGFAKLVGDLGGGQTLRLSYDRREDEGERAQRPQWAVSPGNQVLPLEGTRQTGTLNYELMPAANDWLGLDVTLYRTEQNIEQDQRPLGWPIYHGKVETDGIDVRNTSRLGSHEVTYGVDYRDDRVTAGPEGDRNAESEEGEVTGVYVQDDFDVTDAFLLSFGARYDNYELRDTNDEEFEESGVSANISGTYFVTQGLSVNAGYAEAFRGPMTRDAFKIFGTENDPDLEPEKAENREIGFEYRADRLALSGTVYRTDIEDSVSVSPPWSRFYTNVGDLESKGYVLRGGYSWDRVTMRVGYHHNDTELDGEPVTLYEHNGLGNSIGSTWTTEIEYQATSSLRVGWLGRFVDDIDGIQSVPGTVSKSGYDVHDVYARWQPMGSSNLELTFTVKNLFDEQYVNQASNADYSSYPGYDAVVGQPEPGRDIRVGLNLEF
ncbi:TonB-dependent receptor [Aquisalimonas lutea]|uniref:TonB-dependent receptor domain-containing protein n=1 Tax=Aquisalimonas lutea TaxID=1327750 RepID=UPI0025B2887A|nr:TonB-dependent receptor [Aquisalimonas lutea]MDN3518503.1 TonB-dependent receptor [Aquisalimonas lutea]